MQSNSPVLSSLARFLIVEWPYLLLILGSMAVSAFWWGRARVPATMVIAGMFVVLVTLFLSMLANAAFMQGVATQDNAARDRWINVMPFVQMFISMVRTAGWSAVVAAVFVARDSKLKP